MIYKEIFRKYCNDNTYYFLLIYPYTETYKLYIIIYHNFTKKRMSQLYGLLPIHFNDEITWFL